MKTTVFEKGKQKMNAIKGASAVALGSAVALAGAALPVFASEAGDGERVAVSFSSVSVVSGSDMKLSPESELSNTCSGSSIVSEPSVKTSILHLTNSNQAVFHASADRTLFPLFPSAECRRRYFVNIG